MLELQSISGYRFAGCGTIAGDLLKYLNTDMAVKAAIEAEATLTLSFSTDLFCGGVLK